MNATQLPADRIRLIVDLEARPGAECVVYWMTASRRVRFNHALERAVDWAERLRLPLAIVEVLRCDEGPVTLRNHTFISEGMCENARRLADRPVLYHPFIELSPGESSRVLQALARVAAVIVTDDAPVAGVAGFLGGEASMLPVRVEAVDAWGLLPLATTEKPPGTAYAFRRIMHREFRSRLAEFPDPDPLEGVNIPHASAGLRRLLAGSEKHDDLPGHPFVEILDRVPVDRRVAPVPDTPGGAGAAEKTLGRFIADGLGSYAEGRNHPDDGATSRLSPYLRAGHIAAAEVFLAVTTACRWSPEDLCLPNNGRRAGWWGLSPDAEAFLDQLVTWRELGAAFSRHVPEPERWETLPPWARRTLEEHVRDPREMLYSFEELESARTSDVLWNAAQRQLREEGIIHNYLRMIWGKRVIEWTRDPREAMEILVQLNDRWALDGCDPNSYSGIGWCFGRFDRPWGPRRPIYGTIRYMSSEWTVKKLRLQRWLERWGG